MANIFTYQDQSVHTGDQVKVHLSVIEGDKERIQIFEGIVISIKGSGTGKSFTVRKIASGSIGVERIIPVMSPALKQIEVKSQGQVRRSKLYYLRNRVGKQATKVKTKSDLAVGQAAKTGSKTLAPKKPLKSKSASQKAGPTRRTASQKTPSK